MLPELKIDRQHHERIVKKGYIDSRAIGDYCAELARPWKYCMHGSKRWI